MKSRAILVGILSAISLFTNAQIPIQVSVSPDKTFSQAAQQSTLQLNDTRIPYDVLYDRVAGWSFLTVWESGDTTSFSHISQSWWDLENSKTALTNTIDSLKPIINVELSKQNIPLLAINYGFGYVDSLAVQDGRMRVENDQLIDAGAASPYIEKKVHIAALATVSLVQNIPYKIISDLSLYTLKNLPDENIAGYSIKNLTDGSEYSVPVSGEISISFPVSGTKMLEIVMYTSKNQYIIHQLIEVLPNVNTSRANIASTTSTAPESRLLISDIPFIGYEEALPTISYADYHVYYHFLDENSTISDRILKRPIIILDGFDPDDQRNYIKIYDSLLLYNASKFGDELRQKGYDVVILNFPMTGSTEQERINNGNINIPFINNSIRRDGGTDYIERNAYLLVKLIQDLNYELRNNGSNQKLIIVGPSMGGQISRYALAYMEQKESEGVTGMTHNTKLWISFDSPHEGANIPLSMQEDLGFLGIVGGNQDAKNKYYSNLYNPAARQMLIDQYDKGKISVNGTASFFKTYYSRLRNNGLPNSSG